MNGNKGSSDDERRWCYFHPKELVVGICALCLNERLLQLLLSSSSSSSKQSQGSLHKTHKHFSLNNIFALTTLLDRLHLLKRRKSDQSRHSSSTSPEDSFISIKFEDNGVASWDKEKTSKMPHRHQHHHQQQQQQFDGDRDKARKTKNSRVVDCSKPRAVLRWRRGIGHVFQLISSKRSNKGNMCHVGTKPIRRSKG